MDGAGWPWIESVSWWMGLVGGRWGWLLVNGVCLAVNGADGLWMRAGYWWMGLVGGPWGWLEVDGEWLAVDGFG